MHNVSTLRQGECSYPRYSITENSTLSHDSRSESLSLSHFKFAFKLARHDYSRSTHQGRRTDGTCRRKKRTEAGPERGAALHWDELAIALDCNLQLQLQLHFSRTQFTESQQHAVQSIRLVHPALGSIAANFDACLVDARAHARCLKSHDPVSFV